MPLAQMGRANDRGALNGTSLARTVVSNAGNEPGSLLGHHEGGWRDCLVLGVVACHCVLVPAHVNIRAMKLVLGAFLAGGAYVGLRTHTNAHAYAGTGTRARSKVHARTDAHT